jgi:hypothetical protein
VTVARSGAELLAGNGAMLVRELALAARVQGGLERLYQLDRVAELDDFVSPAQEGEREALLVREADDGTIEMRLRLPQLGDASDNRLDAICQIIEGVSHFVYLANRAGEGRETTQLEMEMQAEVDKYVVLASSLRAPSVEASARLRAQLFERVHYTHAAASELGERYRVANDTAHGFVRRLEGRFLATREWGPMRSELRRFFREGQAEKLRLGRAA